MHPPTTNQLISYRRYHNDHSRHIMSIQKMYNSYHSCELSSLQDHIALGEQCEYLKRFYQENEYQNKVIMLSEYYQYHRELPRIFQNGISSVIQNYHEELRGLQYKFVTRKMKNQTNGDGSTTNREKSSRPVQKIIKNIELSYYNFQNKQIKKHKNIQHNEYKENHNNKDKNHKSINTLNRNKKSMPVLPLYQYTVKNTTKVNSKPMPINNNNALKVKDTNRPMGISKSKDVLKKISVNNSIDSPKNLSRSKSKSNLVQFQTDIQKRNSIKPFQQYGLTQKIAKPKSNPVSLQKASSTRNILQLKQQPKKTNKLSCEKQIQDKIGVKNMFKKIMQTKKLIKIAR